MATEPSVASSHIEHLIGEIESSDGLLGPTLRAVYDGNQPKELLEKLEDRIRTHDKDIERMCNYHYQGFIESVNELLKVRGEAKKLKIKVKQVNEDLQDSGRELVGKCEELIECRTTQRNIASAIESLSVCLPVLDMYAKLKDQMKQKRYYPALKTLEQLEHTYLPRITRFRFAEIMRSSIPDFRDHIKDASMLDLRDFLEKIRKVSEKLGSMAMKQAVQRSSLTLLHGVGGRRKGDDEELDKCAQDIVDFAPVYRCLHIYTVLGERETFETYYRKQRRKQARLALEPSHGVIEESLEAYRSYFHQIVGFFVVEDTILNTTKGLVTRSTVDGLWEMAASKIAPVLLTCTQSAYCKEPSLLLQVKELIVWFSHTLSGFGFNVNQMNEVLFEMRSQHTTTLMKDWETRFREILAGDNYTPLTCETEQEFGQILQDFPFDDSELRELAFPKHLPFSQCVIQIYKEIKDYINSYLKFYENVNVSQTEAGDAVRKSTNLLVTRSLNACFVEVMKGGVTIPQLVQMSVNTVHLEAACPHLEDYVSKVTGTANDSTNAGRLYGLSSFKDMRAEAEQQIYEKLNMKIEEFLDLANYDWLPSKPKEEPSGYLVDLLAYLQSTFMNFSSLQGSVAQTACMSSCKHLANKLRELLLDDEVKQISTVGLEGFNLDLRKCEEFANSGPVEGISDEGTLQLNFVELRQLVDLLLQGDWSTFFADHGSTTSKYSRVSPQVVAKLLEKLLVSEKKRGITMIRKSERDKKKLMDTILKRLRTLNGDLSGASTQS